MVAGRTLVGLYGERRRFERSACVLSRQHAFGDARAFVLRCAQPRVVTGRQVARVPDVREGTAAGGEGTSAEARRGEVGGIGASDRSSALSKRRSGLSAAGLRADLRVAIGRRHTAAADMASA